MSIPYKDNHYTTGTSYGRAKAGRPARTYIQQLCEDMGCSPEDLIRRSGEKGSGISVLAARHYDDDNDDDIYIYIYIYIYICIYIYIYIYIYRQTQTLFCSICLPHTHIQNFFSFTINQKAFILPTILARTRTYMQMYIHVFPLFRF